MDTLKEPYLAHTLEADTGSRIECRDLWKVFGAQGDDVIGSIDFHQAADEVLTRKGAVVAVSGVSFDVRVGETFVIMGLSGSGKSTLLRCMNRLIEPDRGELLIDGEDFLGMTRSQVLEVRRHKIAMVFQHFGNFPHKRVLDNVAFGLQVRGMDKAARYRRAMEVIELVGLSGWEDRYPHELSGGMQQRVGLARALAVDPEILFFDEPFSALDPLIRREMQDELIKLQELVKKTIVFITHDFLEAIKLGDRVAIMKDGRFVQVGTAEEVVAAPADDYVREFTQDVPRSKVLTARSVMANPDLTVLVSETPTQALQRMRSLGCLRAIVLDSAGGFNGMVSVDNIAAAEKRGDTGLSTVVCASVPTALLASSLEEVLRLTIGSDDPVPVVDARNVLAGVVTRDSALSALIESNREGPDAA